MGEKGAKIGISPFTASQLNSALTLIHEHRRVTSGLAGQAHQCSLFLRDQGFLGENLLK